MSPPSTASTDASARSDWQTIRTLLSYLWPTGDLKSRSRVVLAMLCMLIAKFAVIYVQILFGEAIDSLPGLAEAGSWADVDFSNTGQFLSLDVPDGVTWTSESGVFLDDVPAVNPVPEPASMILVSLGLMTSLVKLRRSGNR